MSLSKSQSKAIKTSPPSKKQHFSKKLYHCYYCNVETKNSNEICSYCASNDASNEKYDVNSKYSILSSARIPLKNLVYVVGLTAEHAKEELLSSYEYFGQYGKIKKLSISKAKSQGNRQSNTYSAYITYNHEREATLAIYAIDEITMANRVVRAFFGTTKYCTYFLKDSKCLNEECVYLHEYVKEEILLNGENESQKLTLNNVLPFYEDIKKYKLKTTTTVFPNVSGIIKNLENLLEKDKKPKKIEKTLNKPLDIISLDEVKEEPKDFNKNKNERNTNKEENDSKMKKKSSKLMKCKEYHSEHDESSNLSSESNDENSNFNRMRRKTVNVSEIDELIIKSFISDEFGKNKISRFGFAKNNENDEKTREIIESQRINIAKSIQNFFLKWNNRHNPIEENNLIFNFTSKDVKDD